MLNIESWVDSVSVENGLDPEQIKRKIRETREEGKRKKKREVTRNAEKNKMEGETV